MMGIDPTRFMITAVLVGVLLTVAIFYAWVLPQDTPAPESSATAVPDSEETPPVEGESDSSPGGSTTCSEEEQQRVRAEEARLEEVERQIDAQQVGIGEEWERLRGWESRLRAQEQWIKGLLRWMVTTAVIVGVLVGAQIVILIRTGRRVKGRGGSSGQRRAGPLALTRADGAADRAGGYAQVHSYRQRVQGAERVPREG